VSEAGHQGIGTAADDVRHVWPRVRILEVDFPGPSGVNGESKIKSGLEATPGWDLSRSQFKQHTIPKSPRAIFRGGVVV
jgi:hypothetical protein